MTKLPTVLSVLLGGTVPGVASAQVVALPEVEIRPTGFVVGGGGDLVVPGGEIFEFVGVGYGGHAFIGAELGSALEVRGGLAVSSHGDDLRANRVEAVTIHFDTYFRRRISRVTVGGGPRLAVMQASRAIFVNTLSGVGFGGNIEARLDLGSRSALAWGVTFTSVSFSEPVFQPLPSGMQPDPDLQGHGALWQFRFGVVVQIPRSAGEKVDGCGADGTRRSRRTKRSTAIGDREALLRPGPD